MMKKMNLRWIEAEFKQICKKQTALKFKKKLSIKFFNKEYLIQTLSSFKFKLYAPAQLNEQKHP